MLDTLTAAQLVHDDYGGVVPEIASRQHIRAMLPVYEGLLERTGVDPGEFAGIGVSNGPGLVGSLLVGVSFAKGLAFALRRPVVGVHHIEAHILANELGGEPLRYPCVVLVVSGGHTQLFHVAAPGGYDLVGTTRDDAAGEAFDKVAKLLGLGYPGGPVVERAAQAGDDAAIEFPRAMRQKGGSDFSFSGLKTAVRLHVESLPSLTPEAIADIAASAQRAIVEILIEKTVDCAVERGVGHVYLAGGVAANGPLRDGLAEACAASRIVYHAPLLEYCTDNGAMVARAAHAHLSAGRDDGPALDVFARGVLGRRA